MVNLFPADEKVIKYIYQVLSSLNPLSLFDFILSRWLFTKKKKKNKDMNNQRKYHETYNYTFIKIDSVSDLRYENTRQQIICHDQEPDQDADQVLQDFTNLITALLVDLEQGLLYYNSLFER